MMEHTRRVINSLEIAAKKNADQFSETMVVGTKSILAVTEAFRLMERDNAMILAGADRMDYLAEIAREAIERAETAEAKVQRLNATAQMDMSERDSTKNLKWLFDLSKTCHALGVPVRLSDSQVEKIAEAFQEMEQRLNATSQPVSDGWVKCGERMPGREYVMAADFKNRYPACRPNYQVGIFADWFDDGRPAWDDGDGHDLYLNEITHWMPLPAAPGGQDD